MNHWFENLLENLLENLFEKVVNKKFQKNQEIKMLWLFDCWFGYEVGVSISVLPSINSVWAFLVLFCFLVYLTPK